MNIPIYAPGCEDFTTNGLGMLTPLECVIEEQAAGLYELTLTHPIDDSLRWALIAPGCIIKAPAPVRESPLYEAPAVSQPVTVTRQVWVVSGTTHGLYIRTGPGMNYKRIGVKRDGVQVLELEDAPDPWKKVCVLNSGQVGYMSTKYLRPLRTVTEVVEPARPVPGGILKISQSRDQLFRIYDLEQDSAAGLITARALHVFYDEAGNLIDGKCEFTRPRDVSGALTDFSSKLALEPQVNIHALNLTGNITGDFSYKSPVEALLDPDCGVIRQTRAMLVRDNWEAYLLPDMVRDRGVTVRRGKNLVGVEVTSDASSIATRIIPVGRNQNGDPLYLSGTKWVDSPRAGDHPFPRIRRIEYDVQTGENGLNSDGAVRSELRRLAEAEFSETGADLPLYGMKVDFVLLGNAEGYGDYASLQAVHIYDTVTIIDELLGLRAKVRVTGYKWNCLTGQYDGVSLGTIQDLRQTSYSFSLPDGGIPGAKIMANTLGGSALRNASIEYAKIAVATIEQLNAASLAALTARIQELVAGSITADALYAGIANISRATIEHADINWASINDLHALIANLAQAKIDSADIDWAHIKDLVTDTAIITEGVGGQLFISRLAVTEANMVSLTTGELVVKGEDGHFYSLGVDAEGNVITTLKQLGNDDVQDLSINAVEKLVEGSVTAACLNAREIFADNAVIRSLIAANLDVDALFAREAFVSLLRTSRIVGDKSIEMIAGEAEDAKNAADNAQASADELDRLSNIEVIEGTFVQAERREGEGIHVFSEFGPKQDLTWGDPYPAGGGKNLLNITEPTQTINGVTLTVNEDGTVTVNGTATAEVRAYLNYSFGLNAGEYILSGCPSGGSGSTFDLRYSSNHRDLGNGCAFTFEEAQQYSVMLIVRAGYTADNLLFKPMIRLASDTDATYAPYANTPPIEGWTGLNAGACGKNLFAGWVRGERIRSADGTFYVSSVGARTDWIMVKPSEQIALVGLTETLTNFVAFYDSGKNFISRTNGTSNSSRTVNTPDNCRYIAVTQYESANSTGVIADLSDAVQIELGTPTPYEPYTGKTHTVQFGETIYGGKFEWLTGKLVAEWAIKTLTGTENITIYSNSRSWLFNVGKINDGISAGVSASAPYYKCSHFSYSSESWSKSGKIGFLANTNYVALCHVGISTVDEMKALLAAQYAAGTPVQIAYKLATPIEIQLTPVQLETLKGVNTVYTDADGGRVEFGHELPEVIDNTMAPASPKLGTLWLDRSVTPAVLRRYNGIDWETVNDITMIEKVQDALLTKQAELEAAQRESALFLKLDAVNKVVRIGQEKVTSEFLIDAFGSGVSVNNEIFSRFEANRVVFGNMEMRKPIIGGLAFDSIKT